MLTPIEFIFDALEKDFGSVKIEPNNFEIEKEFVKLLVLELSLSLFLVQEYFGSMLEYKEEEVLRIFEKGNNLEEKLVFFLKQDFETNLTEKDLKILFMKLKRTGKADPKIIDFFMFRNLRIFKKIEVVEEIPQLPVTGIKLKDMALNIQVDTQPENLTNFFVDQNKSVFIADKPEKEPAKKKGKKDSTMPLSKTAKKSIMPRKGT